MSVMYPAIREWLNKHIHQIERGPSAAPVTVESEDHLQILMLDTEGGYSEQAYKWAGLEKYAATPERMKKLLGLGEPRVVDGRLIR